MNRRTLLGLVLSLPFARVGLAAGASAPTFKGEALDHVSSLETGALYGEQSPRYYYIKHDFYDHLHAHSRARMGIQNPNKMLTR